MWRHLRLLILLSCGLSLRPRPTFRLSSRLFAQCTDRSTSVRRIPAVLLLSSWLSLVQLLDPSSAHAETKAIGVPVDVVNIMKSRYAEIRAGVTGEKVSCSARIACRVSCWVTYLMARSMSCEWERVSWLD